MMNINIKENKQVTFGEIKDGETFVYCGALYIKIDGMLHAEDAKDILHYPIDTARKEIDLKCFNAYQFDSTGLISTTFCSTTFVYPVGVNVEVEYC